MALATILPTVVVLMRLDSVKQASGKSRSTIYRNIQAGLFTKPVHIGGDRVAWPSSEVQSINRARIAGKTDADIRRLVISLELARTEPE